MGHILKYGLGDQQVEGQDHLRGLYKGKDPPWTKDRKFKKETL